jgi:hypothetical protein
MRRLQHTQSETFRLSGRRRLGALVALEKHPLEAFEVPKLVKVGEVLSAPAAKVEEHLCGV